MKDFPLIRSPKGAAVSTLLMVLPLLLLSGSALGGMYAVLLVLYLLPTAACLSAAVSGLMPMALGAAAGLFAMYRLFGNQGLLLSSVYLLPILALFLLAVSLRIPFRQVCPVMIGVHAAALAGCFLLVQSWTGGRLYEAAGEQAAALMSRWELGDTMLYQLYSMGMIDLPESLEGAALMPVLGGYVLSAAARQDLLLSLSTMITRTLSLLVPNVIVTQSILGGVACLLLPLRFGYIAAEKRAYLAAPREEAGEGRREGEDEGEAAPAAPPVDFPTLDMPRFETWHLPRGMGWQVGLLLLAGYLLRSSAHPTAAIAGTVLYSAGHAVFSIQGAALVNFMQKSKGTRRGWRVIVPILLLLFSLLVFIGIFDQISNIRRLRKPREPKEEI